jgi:hypothetical protein
MLRSRDIDPLSSDRDRATEPFVLGVVAESDSYVAARADRLVSKPDNVTFEEAANGSPLLFPGERGGYLDIHHFRPFQWRPAQKAAGITPLRRVYDLRHTFATFALRAGISTSDLSRYMGASLTMIDRHYGHLARDGREHAIKLLDALNAPEFDPWTLVDARWTPKQTVGVTRENESES